MMMDSTPDGERKKPPEGTSGGGGGGGGGESKSKRKMKTPMQLELLEKTYAVEAYPSEAIRQELSAKLDLSDRQLQMWFCHRRLKDRKVAPEKKPRKDNMQLTASTSGQGLDEMMMGGGDQGNDPGSGSGSGSSQYEHRKVGGSGGRTTISRGVADTTVAMSRRYRETPQDISELRAIAFVESQLGEALREDGPILGMEFDPLPPGAFGAPIVAQQKQAGRPYDGKMYDRHDTKSIKTPSVLPGSSGGKRKLASGNAHMVHPQSAPRALQEYQFLPEQPSVRSDTYERADPSHFYSSQHDGHSGRASSLSAGGSHLHGKEQVPTGYGQGTSASLQSQQGRISHVLGEYDRMDVQVGLENPLLLCDRRMSNEDEAARLERKRKFAQSDEARIAREVEAHEKRIRKELEKQDILRRKREEQMRREMEKHDRERRKEEERLMREKLREEERFQREQKRELERRERFMQKENLRAEKMRQKEEQRREKEAARQKAANERATARRIAKESMELIEDERLELMELAASSKGLPSIISLDSDTLENLDLFKDMLVTFPPKSVQLSRPFAIQPWKDSEENVGNLLMVWRFLITFADILELWPFTLDEFVQAFHDYDPRLLGEIHVALLRSIVKDIEDVARTPSMGLGANQNSSVNPGGGHPQIVEGAYAWGFDIRSWQQHLNPLTWPEVLRQFALSAGFGPQLKKRSLEQSFFRDENEGHDCEDIVSTLRNGAAAVSAAAVMQEKGLSQPRRSRHRLTPGTVKFAAFHVLSLEGSKGLSILEVADKIQKSGLRDLTTSKTPEASIAAALSRDSHLFERTAPSTYCVREAFRKDPNDADAILSAAREKIQIFANGLSDSEEAGKDVEDADDDSECDVAEDPEVDDVDMTSNQKEDHHLASVITDKSVACLKVGKRENAGKEVGEILQSGHGSAPGSSLKSFPVEGSQEIGTGALTDQSADLARNSNGASTNDLEDAEIDESNTGEPWVQGLMEGEYADLTVEERLNALVALIGVAIEGNSVRVILEVRLEAANALKKQMWAEAQLDKRRMKEEYITKPQSLSFMGKTELNVLSFVVDGSQSPFGDSKNNEASLHPSLKEEPIFDPSNAQIYLNNMSAECNVTPENYQQQHAYAAAEKSRSQYKSYIGQRAEEMYVYRSLPLGQDRKRNRYWQFVTSATRNDPGTGRIFYESQGGCWRLIDTEEAFDILLSSLDIRGIRESHLHSMLQKIEVSFKDAVKRNSKCRNHVDPVEDRVKTEVSEIVSSPDRSAGTESPSSTVCAVGSDTVLQSSSFKIDLGRNETEKTDALKRYQDSQRWMWKECFNPSTMCAIKYGKKRCSELLVTCDFCLDSYFPKDNRCPVCHRIFGNLSNSSKSSDSVNQCEEKPRLESDWNIRGLETSLPLRIRLLKAQVAITEVSIPPEAIQPLWTEDSRNSWGLKLQSSSSAEDLLQILTLLEGAIKRDCLSSSFETTKELLGNFPPPVRAADGFSSGSVPILPWVPQTTAAVALRLLELDAAITYMLQQKAESQKDKESGDFIKLPSKYTVIKNIQEAEPAVTPEPAVFLQEENWFDMGSGRSTSGRGQMIRGKGRGRSAGGRLPRGSSGMRIDSGRVSAGKGEKMVAVQGLGGKSQTARGKGGRKRGKRTAKSRQKSSAAVKKRVVIKDMGMGGFGGQFGNSIVIPKQNNYRESPRSSGGEDEGGWEEDTRRLHDVHVQMDRDDISVEEASGESDDNGLGEYDVRRTDYSGMYNGKSVNLLESDAEDEDEYVDDSRIGDEEDEEDLEEVEGDGYGEDDVGMEERYRLHGVGTNRNVEEIEEDDEEENVDADEAMETDSSDYSE
ncbi:homeobox-DDT domain protein RLT2-like isoform X1 [Papaver somniferum]|uniref:homeobox-DDT domain protein RLT2-like isoform X1 n=1 Tax=Papaver somniferum TaxID=3469 RepID=UPI000E7052DF|nr:homeobox-DDT domain protein RLT2-like isoform X1 [Papaver somniferum]